jgi:hypothetical protein
VDPTSGCFRKTLGRPVTSPTGGIRCMARLTPSYHKTHLVYKLLTTWITWPRTQSSLRFLSRVGRLGCQSSEERSRMSELWT